MFFLLVVLDFTFTFLIHFDSDSLFLLILRQGLVVVQGGLKFIILLPLPPEGAEITGLTATFKSIF